MKITMSQTKWLERVRGQVPRVVVRQAPARVGDEGRDDPEGVEGHDVHEASRSATRKGDATPNLGSSRVCRTPLKNDS